MPLGFAGLVTALLCVLFLPLIPGLGTAPGEGRGRSVAELWTARRLASRAAWQADRGDWKEALRQARLAVLQRPGSADANRVLLACLRHEASQRVSLDPREVHAAASRLLASSANRTEDTRLAMAAAMDTTVMTFCGIISITGESLSKSGGPMKCGSWCGIGHDRRARRMNWWRASNSWEISACMARR